MRCPNSTSEFGCRIYETSEFMIENYQFGTIITDGREYNRDVEVWSDGRVLFWQRKESHFIDLSDIEKVFIETPEIIVIGTGQSGVANVSDEVKKEAQKRNIKLIISPTSEAVEIFNGLKDKKAVAFFHLTC